MFDKLKFLFVIIDFLISWNSQKKQGRYASDAKNLLCWSIYEGFTILKAYFKDKRIVFFKSRYLAIDMPNLIFLEGCFEKFVKISVNDYQIAKR